MKMLLKIRIVVKVVHDELTDIIGCRVRVQIVEQFSESFDLSIISRVNYMAPNMYGNQHYLAMSQEARTIGAERHFSIVAVDKRILEPA